MSTREAVLAGLREAGSGGVSGESLARDLGVSRVAVSKHVAALRELGYRIDASPTAGYRLVSAPDLALPAEVAPLLMEPFWRRIDGGAETGSTNDDARLMAQKGAEEGSVIIAARQTAGRGRLGRAWSSPEGGAYVSVVLRPLVAPAQAGPLALVVAVGIAQGLEALGAHPRLKWPNDVLLGDAKLAGILLEMTAESDRVEWVVAGFGLNVCRPVDAQPGAAYLSDEIPGVRVAQATAAALDGLAGAYAVWRRDGFDSLVEEFESRSALTGREVVVSGLGGNVRASGEVQGIDREGRLLVRHGGRVEAIVAGEVTLRRPTL